MKDLKLPLIKKDFLPPQCTGINEALDLMNFTFDGKPIDKIAVRLQKKWMRFDRPFRIEPSKKAA